MTCGAPISLPGFSSNDYESATLIRRNISGAFIASLAKEIVGVYPQIMVIRKGKLQSIPTNLLPGNQTNLLNPIGLSIGHRTMATPALSTGTFSPELQQIITALLSILPSDDQGGIVVLNILGYCIQHLATPNERIPLSGLLVQGFRILPGSGRHPKSLTDPGPPRTFLWLQGPNAENSSLPCGKGNPLDFSGATTLEISRNVFFP